jgi:hypothetical protein
VGVSPEVDDQAIAHARDDGDRQGCLHAALPSAPSDLGEDERAITEVEERLRLGVNLLPGVSEVSMPPPQSLVPV